MRHSASVPRSAPLSWRARWMVALVLSVGCSDPPVDRSVVASAESTPPAPPAAQVSATKLYRQLSFDLRGRAPSRDELEQVAKAGKVTPEQVDALLKSPEFLEQVQNWHAEILWPNLERYRLAAVPAAAIKGGNGSTIPEKGYWVTPDPQLVVDEQARNTFVYAIEGDSFGEGLRGGTHSGNNSYCDLRPQAEYPDPSVVGTPANRYTVPAERSGTGRAYTALYYSEEAEDRGAVLPIRDYQHCPNYCRKVSCQSLAANSDSPDSCFRDMDTPGDDPGGRHELDTPGMRCADGYVRDVNVCHFWKNATRTYKTERRVPFANRSGKSGSGNGGQPVYNAMREGWRWMEHYWSQGKKIKTCGLEAQEREFGLYTKNADGSPLRCDVALRRIEYSSADASCGCGPRGAYCQPSVFEYNSDDETGSQHRLRKAIEGEPLEIVRATVARDEDYFNILTTKKSFVNGPLAFAFRYQSAVFRGEGFRGFTPPLGMDPTWEKIPYDTDGWTEYTRPGRHAGILTTHGFLLRFPTARARIAQYRRAFLCSKEFDYAPQPDPSDTNPDIAQRAGCGSCHMRLETEGMYFARYPDRTGLFLEPQGYPAMHPACQYCGTKGMDACKMGAKNPNVPGGTVTDPGLRGLCEQYYVAPGTSSSKESPYAGLLRPAVYRDQQLYPRMDQGPDAMVKGDLQNGTALQECAVQQAWSRLVRRDINPWEAKPILEAFESSGRKYRALVRAIVLSDAYKTVQP